MAIGRATPPGTGAGFPSVARALAVISPHLDDAVLGCGELLATLAPAVVVTVFAGVPREPMQAPAWDRRCGFRTAQGAVRARRREDRAALATLDATPVWQDFLDSQYRRAPAVDEVADALRHEIARRNVDVVAMPLGLFHSDHHLVHAACLQVARDAGSLCWIAYEDALYRRRPGLLQHRLVELRERNVQATPLPIDTRRDARSRKARAVRCYASQARAFGAAGLADAAAPERYWALELER